jgi:hypothetical protein
MIGFVFGGTNLHICHVVITSPDSPVKEKKKPMGIGLLSGTSDSKQKKHAGHFLLFNDIVRFSEQHGYPWI